MNTDYPVESAAIRHLLDGNAERVLPLLPALNDKALRKLGYAANMLQELVENEQAYRETQGITRP